MKPLAAAHLLVASLVVACSPANVGGPSDAGSTAIDSGGVRDSGGVGDTESSLEAGADGGISIAQACADSANARCNRIETCSPTAILARYADIGSCVSVLVQNCMNAAAAPSTGTTAASVEGCANAMGAWACNDLIVNKNPPSQCLNATGGLADGAACGFAQQCQTGFCSIVPGAPCGVCANAPKPGDTCASLTTCGQNLACAAANVCEPYGASGDACDSAHFPCSAGLACVGATGTTKGTCQASVTTLGAACVSNGAACDYWAGLACNSLNQVCAPVVLANPGEQCGYVNLQNTGCLDGLCTGIVGAMPGTCVQYARLDGDCDLVSGPFCFTPARCIVTVDGGTAGTCQVPDATMCQ